MTNDTDIVARFRTVGQPQLHDRCQRSSRPSRPTKTLELVAGGQRGKGRRESTAAAPMMGDWHTHVPRRVELRITERTGRLLMSYGGKRDAVSTCNTDKVAICAEVRPKSRSAPVRLAPSFVFRNGTARDSEWNRRKTRWVGCCRISRVVRFVVSRPFLETALIRWMPAYVRLLAYFPISSCWPASWASASAACWRHRLAKP